MKHVLLAAALAMVLGCSSQESEGTPLTDTNEPSDTATPEDATAPDSTTVPDTAAPDTGSPPDPDPPPFYLGGDRPATYFMPFDYDKTAPIPLLISLHGFTGSGAGQDIYFGLSKVTQKNGVMLVIPDGTTNPDGNQFWNATDACCDLWGSGVDDVAYISGLIEEAQTYFNIDAKRVYLVGHSNGGFMSMRMACDRSDLIAGVVNFAGAAWWDPSDCGTPDPVAVLQVHGTWDTTILYKGKTPHEGDPAAVEVNVDTCLTWSCPDHYGACMENEACKAYYDCLIGCSQKPGAQECYGQCWATSPNEARVLWMPTFTCGLGAGCYTKDWTQSWPGYAGAEETVARWAARNGCDDTTDTDVAIDLIDEVAGTDTTPTRYVNCPQGIGAELWTIEYGSHVPGFNGNWVPALVNWLLEQSKP
jgi:poly(3-hydroxybutyrate) depolymerase